MKHPIKRKQINDNTIEVLKIPVGEPPEISQAIHPQRSKEELNKYHYQALRGQLSEKMKMPA